MRRWRAQRRAGLVQPMGDQRFTQSGQSRLAEQALRLSRRDPRKAIELLRIAIESVQPLTAEARR